jgi:hypothetical protein
MVPVDNLLCWTHNSLYIGATTILFKPAASVHAVTTLARTLSTAEQSQYLTRMRRRCLLTC